mgnify:CR=1 FL=1
MFDIRWIRDEPEAFDAALKRRGLAPLSGGILALDARRREAQTELQTMQTRRNEASKAIGEAKRKGGDATALMAEVNAQADQLKALEAKLDEVVELAQYKTGLAASSHIAEDDADFQLFWGLAQRFVPTLYRMQGSSRPVPCIEDIAVPLEALPVFLRHLQDTLKRLQVTASVFGHAAQGQLHIRPFLNMADPDDARIGQHIEIDGTQEVHGLVDRAHRLVAVEARRIRAAGRCDPECPRQ